jgi:hypothetical protein
LVIAFASRMIQRVGHDEVAFAYDGRRERLVGVPGRNERERGGRAHEARERDLEVAVHGERAADESDGRRPGPEALQRLDARIHHRGLVGETEIVVRRQNDDLAASFHADAGTLR